MTEKIKRPEFGQRITWTAVLVREKETNGRKFWRRHELSEARSGLYNGPRSLKNGKLEDRLERSGFDGENYISAEWVRVFVADEHIPAYLVVANANVNPVYVLPEDCAWEPKTDVEKYRFALRLIIMGGPMTEMDGNVTCRFCDYNRAENIPHDACCEWQIAQMAIDDVDGEVSE